MQAVDEMISRVVEVLDRTGRLGDTYIFFTSDNGFHMGQHRLRPQKATPYEEDVRVPLIVRGPGIDAGTERSSLVANIDLAPTILDLAGAEPLRSVDGRSLRPLFSDDDGPDRSVLLESGVPGDETLGVRTPHHLYVEHPTGERELYDLAADPLQLDNLHGDPSSAAIERELASELAALRECAGESCR